MTTRLSAFVRVAALAIAAIGAVVLLGWALGDQQLQGLYGAITMKANTAAGFIIAALALSCFRLAPALCQLAALAMLLLGAATLSEHVVGWDLGIDQLLFTETPGAVATTLPNRMGPNASTSFLLAGTALLLLYHRSPRAARWAQALAFAGVAMALVPVVGYAYGAEELFGVARYTGIALHTAVAFLLLHSAVLAVDPQRGPMVLFSTQGAAGTLLRRLAPWVVILPLLIGFIVVEGRQRALLDRGLGHALFAVSVIVILMALLWHTAAVIDVTDRERQRARLDADRASRLKDQFIAVLSHELRTPLNVMLGRLKIVEDESADPAARSRAATIVGRNGRLLARLVEDLLDLSRASAGQFEITRAPVQLNTLVHAVVDAVAPDAAAKGVTVAMNLGADVGTVAVDQHRMQQVINNLLTNAVKFTGAGGRVDVETALEPRGVTLTVRDTGIGFDEQFAAHLFEPFRQADPSSQREHGGLGLGLSIARHLVDLHGGTITASSPGVGHGAVFTLVLPLAVPQPSDDRTIAA